jgi:iron complex outermembrane receptor protein
LELFAERSLQRSAHEQDYFAERLLVVPSTNPFSPYVGVKSASCYYSFLDDLGPLQLRARTQTFSGTFGAEAGISDSWKVKLSGSYGRETLNYAGHNEVNSAALRVALADPNPETAFNPFGDGSFTNPATIESIRGVRREYSRSGITTANLVADGTAFSLPTGPVKLAMGRMA